MHTDNTTGDLVRQNVSGFGDAVLLAAWDVVWAQVRRDGGGTDSSAAQQPTANLTAEFDSGAA
eukprot:gene9105-4350_t